MNIFHKLDIHYPGTDIRAEAQGSRLGEGAEFSGFPATPLQPRVTGLQSEPSLPPVPMGVMGVSQPHLSTARELIPTDLEVAAPPGSGRNYQPGRCV